MKQNYKFQMMLFILAFWGLIAHTLQAQDNSVTGTVTDEDGDSLPGANVLLQGTTIGTVTDIDGNYRITVQGDNPVLLISSVGYQSQTVEVSGRSTIDVQMNADLTQLGEVVVTAFGMEREKKALTYTVQSVETEEMSEARELNIMNSLSGKIAGISINRSGSGVGGGTRVILRGNRSIAGDSQPLYIVDGVPILGDISDISPDDIESINVLKGPNAAALYGSRANNGAIVVTTKKGSNSGKGFNVKLNNTYMIETPILLTNYQNVYGQGTSGTYLANAEGAWGPRMEGQMVDHWSPDPNWPVEQYPYLPQPDNVKDFLQTGHNFATNLSISAGNEKNQTFFSYTYTDAVGTVPNNELNRHNLNLRLTNKLTDQLTLDSKLNYIREEIDNQILLGENYANPMRHAYRLPRNISTADASIFEYTNANGLNRQNFWNPGSNGGANPYWTANRNLDFNLNERIIGLASLSYDITDNFSVLVRSAFDRAFGENESKRYNDSYVIADNGQFALGKSNSFEWNTDFLVSYEQDINTDWYFNVNVGGNARKYRNSGISANTAGNLTVPNYFALSNTQQYGATHNVGAPKDVNSVYAFGQLAFRNAIFLDLTARNDWSSTLPSDNWSYFYPSVGLNAVISDLIPAFPAFFTFAKLRASYAEVGNDTSPYQLSRTATVAPGGNSGFLSINSTIPNENLKPERTRSIEVGADLRFIDNRIGVDVTYYKTNSTDQLFSVGLPVGSGASSFFTNGGDVQNQGVELILSLTPVSTENFNWDISLNYAYNESLVKEINEERPSLVVGSDFLREFWIEEGRPFGEVYSRGYLRDDAGRVIVDSDGLPFVTDGKTVNVANYNPDGLGGIRNVFSYKNFKFSFLIDIRDGGSISSITNAIIYADGLTEATLQGREGGLIFGDNFMPGETAVLEDGTPNNIPISAEQFWVKMGGRNAPVGEVFTVDASNMRLREAVLGYSLPSSLLSSTFISSVNVSFVARNLFFFYNKAENIDPDVTVGTGKEAAGFDSFAPPTNRSYGLNLSIGF